MSIGCFLEISFFNDGKAAQKVLDCMEVKLNPVFDQIEGHKVLEYSQLVWHSKSGKTMALIHISSLMI